MPGEEVRAEAVKLMEGELSTHGFLDCNDVNVFVAHILDELAVSAIMTEAADVPKEGPHLNPHQGGCLTPGHERRFERGEQQCGIECAHG